MVSLAVSWAASVIGSQTWEKKMGRTAGSIAAALAAIVIIVGTVNAQGLGVRKQALTDAMKRDRQAVVRALAETIQEEITTAPARKAFIDTLFAKLGLDIVADTRKDAQQVKSAIDHLRNSFDVTETDLAAIVGLLKEK